MTLIQKCPLPSNALLARYQRDGSFTDCFACEIGRRISHAEFVTVFYTTPLFRIERLILRLLASKPSTDADAVALAAGTSDTFAAWSVEARAPDQLLLADFTGRTRSWLMVEPVSTGVAVATTRLYFGSAVVAGSRDSALLAFHKVYSISLLAAAHARISRRGEMA